MTAGRDSRRIRPRLGHGSPALCPVRALVGRNSPWFHPFAPRTPQRVPPLCSPASSLLWVNPIASSLPSWVTAFSFPTRPRLSPGESKPSQVPTQDVRACLGSSTPRCPTVPHLPGPAGVAFDRDHGLGTSGHCRFRCSIAPPTRAATNASPTPSRVPTHGSR